MKAHPSPSPSIDPPAAGRDLARTVTPAPVALIVGRVTLEDVLEAHVDQLAALVVGVAACRGRPIAVAAAHAHARLEAAIALMAGADTARPPGPSG